MYDIYYAFNCDSKAVNYLIICKKCQKIYVGLTVTSFRKRFNNHKSSLNKYELGQKGTPGVHLYAHFFELGNNGLDDLVVKVIDRTNVNDPTVREVFWICRLNTFCLRA